MSYYVEYYKEKDTDPMVFLQRFRCTTEPIGGGTEQDEEGELVSWDAAVAAIEIAMKQLGWHPASETPKLGEDDDNEFIVIASVDNELYRHGPKIDKPKKAMFIDGQWTEPDVKWWCYPPKEE